MPVYINKNIVLQRKPTSLNDMKKDRKKKIEKDSPQEDSPSPDEATTYARDIEEDDKSEMTPENKELDNNFGFDLNDKFLKDDERSGLKDINLFSVVSPRNIKLAALIEQYVDELCGEVDKRIKSGELTLDTKYVKLVVGTTVYSEGDIRKVLMEALTLPRERRLQVKASFKKMMITIKSIAEDGDGDSLKDLIFKFFNKKTKMYLFDGIDNQREVKDVNDTEKEQDQTKMFQQGNPANVDHNSYQDTYVGDPYHAIMQNQFGLGVM